MLGLRSRSEKIGSGNSKNQDEWGRHASPRAHIRRKWSHGLQEAFAKAPGPPGPQKRTKNNENQVFAGFGAIEQHTLLIGGGLLTGARG